jgi:Immunity protein Imm1
MFVTTMTTDYWEGVKSKHDTVLSPSWTEIEAAIACLDSETLTMVTLRGEGEAHLAVGGGGGRYVVYATFDNQKFLTLTRGGEGRSKVSLSIGGQMGEYPEDIVVDGPLALAAAKSFAESGQINDHLHWLEK